MAELVALPARSDSTTQTVTSAHKLHLHPAVVDFISGGVSGAVAIVAGQPLDVVRIQQQTNSQAPGGTAAAFRALVQRGGLRSLLKGAAFPISAITFQTALTFQAYGAASRYLAGPDQHTSLAQVYLSGMFAGAVQAGITTPSDLLKIRMQLQPHASGSPAFIGPRRMLRNVVKAEGIRGLYRGYGITLLRDVPSYGLYFAAYHAMTRWAETLEHPPPAASIPLIAGGVAGVSSWLAVYPLDTLKARLQATPAPLGSHSVPGWRSCAQAIMQQQGRKGFFRGLAPTLQRAFVINGALFSTYGPVEKLLNGL